MAEIVNLRRARKRHERDEASKTAQENRVRHGLTSAQKTANKAAREKHDTKVDGAKLTEK